MFESNPNLASPEAPFSSSGDDAPVSGSPEHSRLVGVQFRRAGVIHDFEAGDLPLKHDARVVVTGDRGEQLGWVVGEPEHREPLSENPPGKVLRIATDADLVLEREHAVLEQEALRWAAGRVRESNLPMKMVAAEWSHSGGKITLYFSSEERPDFRELVRDLAQRYRARVEMRHVSPRDETKIIGALGPCGRETCCSSWLRGFSPVTIQMAKDQGLAINPQKVAGVCGRLLCCLSFEQETYAELRRELPRYGRNVQTPQGRGRVVDVLTLRGRVRVQLQDDGSYAEFDASEVTGGGKRGGDVAQEAAVSNVAADPVVKDVAAAPVVKAEPKLHRRDNDTASRPSMKGDGETDSRRTPSRSTTASESKVRAESTRQTESEKAPAGNRRRHRSRSKAAAPSNERPAQRASSSSASTAKTNVEATPGASTEPSEGGTKSGRSRNRRRKRSQPSTKPSQNTAGSAEPKASKPHSSHRKTATSGQTKRAVSPAAGPASASPNAPRTDSPKRSGGRSRTRNFRSKPKGPNKPGD